MNSIIIGNGINIEYGGQKFSNINIILRAIHNVETNNFSTIAYTKDILDWFKLLYQNVSEILNGSYDQLTVFEKEKKELFDFKNRYKNKDKIYEIGFEDYFFFHTLFCRKNKIGNPEQFDFRGLLKRFFLDSIYCNSEINELFKHYPKSFLSFFSEFDKIFTTNYDRNIELFTVRDVGYLHGAFHLLDDVYNPDSFRNKLSDRPIDNMPNLKGIEYLFSNAISDSSGDLKDFSGTLANKSNSVIDKFTIEYQTNSDVKKQIDGWKDSNNSIEKNLYETIVLKLKNSKLRYSEDIAIDKLNAISGKITLLGLSPYNDNHLFERINNNNEVTEIFFYYFNYNETKTISIFLNNKKIHFNNVNDFWKKLGNPSA